MAVEYIRMIGKARYAIRRSPNQGGRHALDGERLGVGDARGNRRRVCRRVITRNVMATFCDERHDVSQQLSLGGGVVGATGGGVSMPHDEGVGGSGGGVSVSNDEGVGGSGGGVVGRRRNGGLGGPEDKAGQLVGGSNARFSLPCGFSTPRTVQRMPPRKLTLGHDLFQGRVWLMIGGCRLLPNAIKLTKVRIAMRVSLAAVILSAVVVSSLSAAEEVPCRNRSGRPARGRRSRFTH